MKLYERPGSPYWWAVAVVGGKRYRWSTKVPAGRKTRSQAAEAAAEEMRRIAQEHERHYGRREMTLAEGLERLLAESRHLSDVRNMESRARKLVAGPGYAGRYGLKPDTLLSEITTDTILRLRAKRRAEGNSGATINREIALLQRLYNAAADWGAVTQPGVRFPLFEERHKLRYLTDDEVTALLGELDPNRPVKGLPPPEKRNPVLRRKLQDQYDLTVFLLDTGCRYSEAATMPWLAVDTKEWRSLAIYRTKVQNEGTLPISNRLAEILKRRRRETNGPYIFPGYGDAKHRGYAVGGIRAAIERAGLNEDHKVERYGRATVHTLRDTFASRLVMAGVSLYKVSLLLGHADVSMTQKYAHLAPDAVSDEVRAVLNG